MASEKYPIDANGSFTINACDNTDYGLCFGGGIISAIDKYGHIICEFFADDAPAINAVEVVRCKDCKHWTTDGNGYLDDSPYCGNPDGIDGYTKPDDFCSHGEKSGGSDE